MLHTFGKDGPVAPFGLFIDVRQRAQQRFAELDERCPEIAACFDIASSADDVRKLWRHRGYADVAPPISARWRRIRERFGEAGLAHYNGMLLCKLIVTTDVAAEDIALPPVIRRDYAAAYARILDKLDAGADCYWDPSDDTFLKDVGICSRNMIPAGYYVLAFTERIKRRLAFSDGVRQFFEILWLSAVRYRRGPFLFVHYHEDHKDKFTPEGRVDTFRKIAELVIWRPEFKAVLGKSWFYDPALRTISPHLAYVREIPERNGALFFRGNRTTHRGVFTSRTRQRLYEEGKYAPREYAMVWPREKLIAWAEQNQFSSRPGRRH